jgi:hypothetical protein
MQPSRRHCICVFFQASLAMLACLLAAPRSSADNLAITSSPPGASVEIDGLVAGTTPYKTDFPGGYFHKTHTTFGTRLEHAMTLRVSMSGYLTQQITITNGPFEWDAINGRRHGSYFLLKANHFEIKLEPIPVGSVSSEATEREGPMRPAAVEAQSEENKAASGTGSVAIGSDPPGADIYVDGKFVGQTPSSVRLTRGLHHIQVKAENQQAWERDLEVLKDSQLTLHAVFTAQH